VVILPSILAEYSQLTYARLNHAKSAVKKRLHNS
jgi:hypothetical protein